MKPKWYCRCGENPKKHLLKNEDGIALIAVLTVMMVLVALVMSLHREMRDTVISARESGDETRAYHVAATGVAAGMALLIRDRELTEIDSVQEEWNDPEIVAAAVAATGITPVPEVIITDELGKIQVNALVARPNETNGNQVKLWERFLLALSLHDESLMGTNPYTVLNPMIDWLDSGDDDRITGLNGAETGYYEGLEPPYAPRNDYFTHLSELQRVRGVTPELWAAVGGAAGLSRVMTVWGQETRSGKSLKMDGKININTASREVIASLITEASSYHMAEEMWEYREEKSEGVYMHGLEGKWYRQCPGCEDVPLAENLITDKSDLFRITARAKVDGGQVRISSVVRREKDAKSGRFICRVLHWSVE